jgi:ribose transport system ATP-binding protein
MRFSSIHDARAAGIGMVFQEFSLVPTLTVAQNIYLDHEPVRGGLIDDRRMRRDAAELLRRIEVDIDPGVDVETLSTAQWQLTEIAKALSQDARILIMDEPTAALGPAETAQVRDLITQLKAEGIGIFLISHDIHDVFDLADRISVMLQGKLVGTVNKDDVTKDEVLAMIIIGKLPGEVSKQELTELTH